MGESGDDVKGEESLIGKRKPNRLEVNRIEYTRVILSGKVFKNFSERLKFREFHKLELEKSFVLMSPAASTLRSAGSLVESRKLEWTLVCKNESSRLTVMDFGWLLFTFVSQHKIEGKNIW